MCVSQSDAKIITRVFGELVHAASQTKRKREAQYGMEREQSVYSKRYWNRSPADFTKWLASVTVPQSLLFEFVQNHLHLSRKSAN